MPSLSAGLLLHRRRGGQIEVLLAHPGGPFWAKRDEGAWSVPKGEHGSDEDPLEAARREWAEELGQPAPEGQPVLLGARVQPSRKRVTVFAVEGDLDPSSCVHGTFEMEWPPRSGRRQNFPEVDRVEWFDLAEARRRILVGQAPFLDDLEELVRAGD